jgi:mono/diheme cytochrome c family protein
MMGKTVILGGLVILTLGGTAGVWAIATGQALTSPPGQAFDLAEGERLYQDYCAACHGANLEGQPDWRSAGPDGIFPAPPHDETGHTWHHSDSVLFDYTKLGGKAALARQGVDFTSGMPGFGDQLTDPQIRNILAFIKSTWPSRQREVQAARSDAERQQQGN